MTNEFSLKSFFLGKTTLLIIMLLFSATFLNAQTVTFAQFFEANGSNDFAFVNNGANASFNTVSGGSAISFVYQNIAGLPGELSGPQAAHIYVTAATNTPATLNGNRTVQAFDQTFTIQILRDTPASLLIGSGSRTNLLTAVITSTGASTADLTGDNGGSSAAYTATTPNQILNFTSDFLDFSAPVTERNLALSFSSVEPSYSMGNGGFLRSFGAAGSGTFASNPGPIYNPPTAAASSVGGRVFNAKGRGVANARVILTESSGAAHAVLTNSFGYFKFPEVETGQTVVINVLSKQSLYSPKVLNITSELDGLSFLPE